MTIHKYSLPHPKAGGANQASRDSGFQGKQGVLPEDEEAE